MEPRFTHSCHHNRKTNCAACAQEAVEADVLVQEQALRDELLVLFLREDHGPKTVHAILGGTRRGQRIYDDIKARAAELQ